MANGTNELIEKQSMAWAGAWFALWWITRPVNQANPNAGCNDNGGTQNTNSISVIEFESIPAATVGYPNSY